MKKGIAEQVKDEYGKLDQVRILFSKSHVQFSLKVSIVNNSMGSSTSAFVPQHNCVECISPSSSVECFGPFLKIKLRHSLPHSYNHSTFRLPLEVVVMACMTRLDTENLLNPFPILRILSIHILNNKGRRKR